MREKRVDLKAQQRATLERPPCKYSLAARLFFAGMDLVAGRATTLAKVRLLEALASIPYREWESRQYARMTRGYRDSEVVRQARAIASWTREAQDNEYWHLLVINEKMRQDGLQDPWYLRPPIPWLVVLSYVVLSRLTALVSIRRAFLFNAEFEDHAEHVYARLVQDHPEWEDQPVASPLVREYGDLEYADLETWADVFRLIALDERDHRNTSFTVAGKPEAVAAY